MTPQTRDLVIRLGAERAGLALGAWDATALEARLAPLARREGFAAVDDLIAAVNARNMTPLAWRAVEALVPAQAGFFRHPAVFDQLGDWAASRARDGRRLRVWVAGCGGGQEAYSLAMALEERPDRPACEIIASDLSVARLEKAQAGAFSAYDVQRGLSARRLVRWFEKEGSAFVAAPRLRSLIAWSRVNMVEDIARLGRFDVILCRGLTACLTPTARARVGQALAGALEMGGRLVVGPEDAGLEGWTRQGVGAVFTPMTRTRLAA